MALVASEYVDETMLNLLIDCNLSSLYALDLSCYIGLNCMLVALNGLDVMACDLENAYLNAPCTEKIWFVGKIECGEDNGKVLVLVRALYGLKSA